MTKYKMRIIKEMHKIMKKMYKIKHIMIRIHFCQYFYK